MILARALGVEDSRLISICGAGGKTSLMLGLAREFAAAGERVLVTTTTKMALEEPPDGWPVALLGERDPILDWARKTKPGKGVPMMVFSAETPSRLIGLPPDVVGGLSGDGVFDRILVEVDGAQRKPLKAPCESEPVLPAATDALVMLAGLDGLGGPLVEEYVFRPEIFSALSGLAAGAEVTPESLAKVVVHADGLGRGCPPDAKRALFLNRADTPERKAAAVRIAGLLAGSSGIRPSRVVWGCLKPNPEIVDLAISD